MCTGYYRYEAGYPPEFVGREDFAGQVVHPQHWPEDLDYSGKKVVVIGSGATAVTLVPSLTDKAAHVTMLQRSPTYLFPYPWKDPITSGLQKVLPRQWSHDVTRYRNMMLTIDACCSLRRTSRSCRVEDARDASPSHYAARRTIDVDTHFKPAYQPWDQRLCVIPEGDFYRAIKAGTADVATDTIKQITATGIDLDSGRHLDADIIVTATGLELVAFGGIDLRVDGEKVEPGEEYAYRGYMLNDVPNFAWSVGYTNASWTLRVDLTSKAVAELLCYMRSNGFTRAVPTLRGAKPKAHPLLELDSGYVKRAASRLPKAGDRAPWQVRHNALIDAVDARRYDVAEEMVFARPKRTEAEQATESTDDTHA